jgi:hypothetical protein
LLLAKTVRSESSCRATICPSASPSASVSCRKTQSCDSRNGNAGSELGRSVLKTFIR